jgi:nicotinamide riboside kinase
MKTIIVNLYGGPGTGKSTTAAGIYYYSKLDGINSELVREYVKKWAWENKQITKYDQNYILAKQISAQSALYNKVPLIITDSPIWLSPIYENKYQGNTKTLDVINNHITQATNDGVINLHFFIKRSKSYEQAGRYENEEHAKQIDADIINFLTAQNINFTIVQEDTEKVAPVIYTKVKELIC